MIIVLIIFAPLLAIILFMLWPYVLFLAFAVLVGCIVSLFLDGYKITPYWGPISVFAMFVVYCVLAGIHDSLPTRKSRPAYDYDADNRPE